jgi:hypothetical protein
MNGVISEARACAVTLPSSHPGGRLPSELCDVALRAMARDPNDRYQNVLQLQRALQAAMGLVSPK